MKQNIVESDKAIYSVEDKIFEFLELSQKILTLVKHENAILESFGCLSIESYLEHRNALLQNYEEEARTLIEDGLKVDIDIQTRQLLVSELSAVKNAITDNTVHRFKSLKNTVSLRKGDSVCH